MSIVSVISESRSVMSTLCDLMGYTVHGILQARVLEWVAFPFSSLPAEPQGKPKGSFNVPNMTYSCGRLRVPSIQVMAK